MKKDYSGYRYILLSAVIFSTMEVALKTVSGIFAPMQITALRFFIGGALLLPFAFRSLKRKKSQLRLADLPYFALTGFLCVCLSMVLYQMAVTFTKASAVAVIFSCNPIFVTVLAGLLLGERIRKNHIAALCLEVLAVLIIIDPLHAVIEPTGAVLAILAALTFALYSVTGKKGTARFGGIAVTSLSFLCGAAELLTILLLGRTQSVGAFFRGVGLGIFADVPLFESIPLSALPAFLYISVVVTAGGFVCHMMAMEQTSAREASLIFFLKPMLAPVFALIFLREEIPLNMWLGIVCFLLGSGIAVIPGLLEERQRLYR